ncbi:MAG: hypothetical protein EZS28_048746 [Streblomastix strix]|uniref:ISXO2-like transposase domain-containing protein n=1 Tax=Streblomastix strix TaxID=222440 RepID=A0A5J4TBW6_9EUKA|nr:MAG: hypothetical protein EZS28_048746 [Streblomastix strix]
MAFHKDGEDKYRYRCKDCAGSTKVSIPIVSKWYERCRNFAIQYNENRDEKIGGRAQTVQVDEMVVGRRKYNVGRQRLTNWVLGIIQTVGEKRGQVSLSLIQNRGAASIIPVTRRNVEQGTLGLTDGLRKYQRLPNYGYLHQFVNHKENIVDPVTQVNTQTIERLWRSVRTSFPVYGMRRLKLNGYLQAFSYKRNNGQQNFEQFLTDLSLLM